MEEQTHAPREEAMKPNDLGLTIGYRFPTGKPLFPCCITAGDDGNRVLGYGIVQTPAKGYLQPHEIRYSITKGNLCASMYEAEMALVHYANRIGLTSVYVDARGLEIGPVDMSRPTFADVQALIDSLKQTDPERAVQVRAAMDAYLHPAPPVAETPHPSPEELKAIEDELVASTKPRRRRKKADVSEA